MGSRYELNLEHRKIDSCRGIVESVHQNTKRKRLITGDDRGVRQSSIYLKRRRLFVRIWHRALTEETFFCWLSMNLLELVLSSGKHLLLAGGRPRRLDRKELDIYLLFLMLDPAEMFSQVPIHSHSVCSPGKTLA